MDFTILKIQEIFKNNIAAAGTTDPIKNIKKVFYGDPVLIPKVNTPALVIMPSGQDISPRSNLKDQSDDIIVISYVYNIKDTFGDTDGEKVAYVQEAVKLLAGRDTPGGSFSEKSIVGILRKEFDLDNTLTLQKEIRISYNFDLMEDKTVVFKANLIIGTKIISNF